MYAPIGSAVPMRRMAPMGGTIMVSNSAYPVATNYAAPFAPRRGTISVVQASKKNLEPAGGVGIAFEDRLDQRSGGMLKIVAEVFSEGAAADWNSTAEEDKKIHPGDLLVEVNGERVAGLDMHTLSTMVPGPVGTPVILRLRSVKENKEFEVELVRQTPTAQLGWKPNYQGVGSPPPVSSPSRSAPPEEEKEEPKPKTEAEEHYFRHEAKITTMKFYGERLACPGFSIEPVTEDKQPQEGFKFMIGNVTKGSQAYEFGFRHGEVLEAIDGISVKDWEEKNIKSLLMDAAYTSVQVHTDKRIVPVNRDCDAEPTLFKQAPMSPVVAVQPVSRMVYSAPVVSPRYQVMSQPMPPMPRTGREFVPYFQPARATSIAPQYAPMGPPNFAPGPEYPPNYAPVAPEQDYGYMAPGNQPQYSTVQAPTWAAYGP
eukprot:GHVU01109644.1.p1 GENE.GHVU01109644.1~~GHVU01109644.1.p1  ORF type:complete len:434 (-),score=61.83 GHVU01109644.1:264-1544(-)